MEAIFAAMETPLATEELFAVPFSFNGPEEQYENKVPRRQGAQDPRK